MNTDLSDTQIADVVTRLVRTSTCTAVARELGISRMTVLGIVSGTARRGSLSLVRERLRERPDLAEPRA